MSIRVFEENPESTGMETIDQTTSLEELKELINGEDHEIGSGNDWGDQAHCDWAIRTVWGRKFDSKVEKWCSITDMEKEGWIFQIDGEKEIVIATNPKNKEYELNLNDFGWFKWIEIF